MIKLNKSLREIVEENKFVVIDTSILSPSNASESLQSRYIEELKKLIKNDKTIYTTKDIILESQCYNSPEHLSKLQLRKFNERRNSSPFELLVKYLTPKARKLGIIEGWKKYPMADVNLAALAFTLAYAQNKVAFLSSDRRLNELVYSTTQEIKDNYPKGFPCLIQGQIEVYSFIQKHATFLPYFFDDKRLGFN